MGWLAAGNCSNTFFTEAGWQYVLYAVGWKTDLGGKAGIYRYHDEARQAFARVRGQADHAIGALPSNRDLVNQAPVRGFGPQQGVAA